MNTPHSLLGCTCALCHTWRWRRVGLVFTRPNLPPAFGEFALRRAREFYSELLDLIEFPIPPGGPWQWEGLQILLLEGGRLHRIRPLPVEPSERGAYPAEAATEAKAPGLLGPNQATAKATLPKSTEPHQPEGTGLNQALSSAPIGPELEAPKAKKEKKKKEKKNKSKKDRESRHQSAGSKAIPSEKKPKFGGRS